MQSETRRNNEFHGVPASDKMPQKRAYLLEELSWPEARAAFADKDLVIIPVGSTEEHGSQNPLGTDFYIARALAEEIGRKAGVLLAPAIPVGSTPELLDCAGTISIDPGLLADLLFDIGSSFNDHGIARLLFINGHDGNSAPIRLAADRLFWEKGVFSVASEWWQLLPETLPHNAHAHGGSLETSLMLRINASIVDMTQTKIRQISKLTERIGFDHGFTLNGASIDINLPLSVIAASGAIGGPAEDANFQLGKDVFDFYTDYMAAFVQDLCQVDLADLVSGRGGAQ